MDTCVSILICIVFLVTVSKQIAHSGERRNNCSAPSPNFQPSPFLTCVPVPRPKTTMYVCPSLNLQPFPKRTFPLRLDPLHCPPSTSFLENMNKYPFGSEPPNSCTCVHVCISNSLPPRSVGNQMSLSFSEDQGSMLSLQTSRDDITSLSEFDIHSSPQTARDHTSYSRKNTGIAIPAIHSAGVYLEESASLYQNIFMSVHVVRTVPLH